MASGRHRAAPRQDDKTTRRGRGRRHGARRRGAGAITRHGPARWRGGEASRASRAPPVCRFCNCSCRSPPPCWPPVEGQAPSFPSGAFLQAPSDALGRLPAPALTHRRTPTHRRLAHRVAGEGRTARVRAFDASTVAGGSLGLSRSRGLSLLGALALGGSPLGLRGARRASTRRRR